MPTLSHGNIPAELLAAKEMAFSQYFTPGATATTFAAFAAHPRPQHNVVGVGVGKKIVKGRATAHNCVRIYVEKKLPKAAIPAEFMLPAKLNNVPVDVIETGVFRAFASKPKEQQLIRPARPGCSVGFAFTGAQAGSVMAGTFGVLVEKGGQKFILSNNHVLANENSLPKGSPIFQPGLLDLNDPTHDQIARLTDFIKLETGKGNKVDCAIAEVDGSVSPRLMPQVNKLKTGQPVVAAVGMAVEKVGRTTSFTTGKITDVSANVKVTYDIGTLTFVDQILIAGSKGAFSAAGDSGSLIVDQKGKAPVGLLFAGSPAQTIANHIGEVLGALNVTIVT